MKTLIDYLKQLDLSEIEAKIYINLIEGGPKRVRELAEAVGLKRTTAYLHIESLVSKGLISEEVKESGVRISANPPQRLKYLVEQKLKTAQSLNEQLPGVLNTIKTSFSQQLTPPEETEIKYLKGINSIRAIYEEALSTNELRSYVKLEEVGGIFPDNITLFNNAFNKNKRLIVREILYDSSPSDQQTSRLLSKNNRYYYKLIPKDLKLTSEDILIYNSKVAILNYKSKLNGVVLHNIDYYNNSKELFDFIWKMIPDIKNER